MLKTIVVMLLAITAGAVGDIFLTLGMKDLGDFSSKGVGEMLNMVFRAMTSPRLIFGTALQAIYFGLWLAVLSWEDLSVALPMQALNYMIVAFLSQWYLGESVTFMRWTGIVIICIGVGLVTKSSGA
ncbi:MAG TPA: EamA family transporter [Geobacteraceae bacterium]|nr:EamA family transporter [Geobacteraceae bacterium]